MLALDMRSFNLLAALQCAVLGLVLMGMQRNFPSRIQGLRLWALAALLALGATVFYGLQGFVSATLVGLGGNGLLLACTVCLLAGTRAFLGLPWRWAPWVSLCALCLLGLWLFFDLWPDYRPRMMLFGLAMALICAAHTRTLYRHAQGFASRVMLLAMAWQTVVLLARALSTYWVDLPTTQRFDPGSPIHTVFVATFSFTILMVLVGAQLMASDRVRQEFEHLARHDELTRLFNRRAILEQVGQEHERFLRLGQPYALLLLDLDHFKRINDTHGHQAGDRTLRHVADEVQQALRATDRLGRYGGEEFLALLPASDPASARSLAERLRARVEALQPGPDNTPGCTVSIGVATVLPTDTQWDSVLTRADQALYLAKEAGRNRVQEG